MELELERVGLQVRADDAVPRHLQDLAREPPPPQVDPRIAPFFEGRCWAALGSGRRRRGWRSDLGQADAQARWEAIPQPESLEEHLLRQLGQERLDADGRRAAVALVASLDERGYLAGEPGSHPVAALAQREAIPLAVVEGVRQRLLRASPMGCGALDWRECLIAQLTARRGDLGAPRVDLARRIAAACAGPRDLRDVGALSRRLGAGIGEVRAARDLLLRTPVAPANTFDPPPVCGVRADVVVREVSPCVDVGGRRRRFVAFVEDEPLRLSLDEVPAAARAWLVDEMWRAKQWMRLVPRRAVVLQRIAQAIVDAQEQFFEEGPTGLKPLTRDQVARALGCHESKVVRAVKDKWAETPMGFLPLSYFFDSCVQRDDTSVGGKCVREFIRALVAREDRRRPLSDVAIAAELRKAGFIIARRTVAKYRLMLSIPETRLRLVRSE